MKYKVGKLSPDFKTLLSDSNQDKYISRTTETEKLMEQSPKIDQHIQNQLIFDKDTKAV